SEEIKGSLPKTDQIKSKLQHQFVEPLGDKAAKVQKAVKSRSEQVRIRSLLFLIDVSFYFS
ncbi:hypothetical protein, partial [Corallococcus sp. AB038B]|uniref:hypothetical protein n=1 Tax=Corallococcus sp. AB038B TaxID=2316718 RepID=UPI001F3DBE8C